MFAPFDAASAPHKDRFLPCHLLVIYGVVNRLPVNVYVKVSEEEISHMIFVEIDDGGSGTILDSSDDSDNNF